MRYRKRPVEVEAFQWSGETGEIDVPDWFVDYVDKQCNPFTKNKLGEIVVLIESSEGIAIAEPGDYIIKGDNGMLLPCKPDTFEVIYESI